jgi:hypothetical protein
MTTRATLDTVLAYESGYVDGQIDMRARIAAIFDCDCPANTPKGACPISQGSMRCLRLNADRIRAEEIAMTPPGGE